MKITLLQVYTKKITPPQDYSARPPTTVAVHDIVSLRKAFTAYFDTIGNMPGTYIIHTSPNIQPGQHTGHKVPIKYREQIEKNTSGSSGLPSNHPHYPAN